MRDHRRSLVLLAVGLLVLLGATAALARRSPTRSEASGIRTAVVRYQRSRASVLPRDSRITKIVVSTVNSRYALVTLSSPSVGTERALLRRNAVRRARRNAGRRGRAARRTRSGARRRARRHRRARRPRRPARRAQWRVLGAGPGAPGCSSAPRAVLDDLFGAPGSCAPGGY